MDTPFPRLCKPQRQPVVIFNNLAALHFIFYTKKNLLFATYFNKKKIVFSCEYYLSGVFQAKKVPFCVVLASILPAKCVAFFEIRVKSAPYQMVIFDTSSAESSRHCPGARAASSARPPMASPVQAVHARAVHAEHALYLMIYALPQRDLHGQAVGRKGRDLRRRKRCAVRQRDPGGKAGAHLLGQGGCPAPQCRSWRRGALEQGSRGQRCRHRSAAQSRCWSCPAAPPGTAAAAGRRPPTRSTTVVSRLSVEALTTPSGLLSIRYTNCW